MLEKIAENFENPDTLVYSCFKILILDSTRLFEISSGPVLVHGKIIGSDTRNMQLIYDSKFVPYTLGVSKKHKSLNLN